MNSLLIGLTHLDRLAYILEYPPQPISKEEGPLLEHFGLFPDNNSSDPKQPACKRALEVLLPLQRPSGHL